MAKGYCWARTALFITPKCVCVFTRVWPLTRVSAFECVFWCEYVWVCVKMKVKRDGGVVLHTYVFGTLDLVQVLCFLLLFLWIIFIPQGRGWSQGQNFDEVCVFICLCACVRVCVCDCVRVCLSIYNTRTVMQRGAAYWLSEVEERASVLAGRATQQQPVIHLI